MALGKPKKEKVGVVKNLKCFVFLELFCILYFRFMLFILFSLSLDLDIDYDAETELFFEECKIFMSQFVDEVFIQE